MLGKTKARRINSILRAYVYVYDPSVTGVVGRLALMTGLRLLYDLRRLPEKRNATWVLEKELYLRMRKSKMWSSPAGIVIMAIAAGMVVGSVIASILL